MAKTVTLEYPYNINAESEEPGSRQFVAFVDFPNEAVVPEGSVPMKQAQVMMEEIIADLLNNQKPFPVPSAPAGREVVRVNIIAR